jgi:hypothetical protein
MSRKIKTPVQPFNTKLSVERYEYLVSESERRGVYMIDILNEAIDMHREKSEKVNTAPTFESLTEIMCLKKW